jgi:response regulator RpfG family c-di-GMP phosphodiesterase
MDDDPPNPSSLEDLLGADISEVCITPLERDLVDEYLTMLEGKDRVTYEHSLRVEILAHRVGKYIKTKGFYGRFNLEEFFFASVFHDIGKIGVDSDLFSLPPELFDQSCRDRMKCHPVFSYHIIKPTHPVAAGIALRHHLYQNDPYPEELPPGALEYPAFELRDMEYHAKVLAIVDTYDSIYSGKGPEENRNPDYIKGILLKKFPELNELIEGLFCDRILGDHNLYHVACYGAPCLVRD